MCDTTPVASKPLAQERSIMEEVGEANIKRETIGVSPGDILYFIVVASSSAVRLDLRDPTSRRLRMRREVSVVDSLEAAIVS